jgi:hypothetical protein
MKEDSIRLMAITRYITLLNVEMARRRGDEGGIAAFRSIGDQLDDIMIAEGQVEEYAQLLAEFQDSITLALTEKKEGEE